MQVNHLGAEDDHRPDNLETVCPACHSVMHIGINILQGVMTLFECKKSVISMAPIVRETRKLVEEESSSMILRSLSLARFSLMEARSIIRRRLLLSLTRWSRRSRLPIFVPTCLRDWRWSFTKKVRGMTFLNGRGNGNVCRGAAIIRRVLNRLGMRRMERGNQNMKTSTLCIKIVYFPIIYLRSKHR